MYKIPVHYSTAASDFSRQLLIKYNSVQNILHWNIFIYFLFLYLILIIIYIRFVVFINNTAKNIYKKKGNILRSKMFTE